MKEELEKDLKDIQKLGTDILARKAAITDDLMKIDAVAQYINAKLRELAQKEAAEKAKEQVEEKE
jgi:hypothetical protein